MENSNILAENPGDTTRTEGWGQPPRTMEWHLRAPDPSTEAQTHDRDLIVREQVARLSPGLQKVGAWTPGHAEELLSQTGGTGRVWPPITVSSPAGRPGAEACQRKAEGISTKSTVLYKRID